MIIIQATLAIIIIGISSKDPAGGGVWNVPCCSSHIVRPGTVVQVMNSGIGHGHPAVFSVSWREETLQRRIACAITNSIVLNSAQCESSRQKIGLPRLTFFSWHAWDVITGGGEQCFRANAFKGL